jgi:hypothetical protein
MCKLLGVDKHILFLTHSYTKTEKDRRGAEFYKYYPSSRIPDKVWDMIEGRVRYFLRAYVKGEEEKMLRLDTINWMNGIYTQSAVGVAVEHCLNGTKARSKYIEKPMLHEAEEKKQIENGMLSEEEKRKQTEQFFMKLRIMGANHKLANKQGDKVS